MDRDLYIQDLSNNNLSSFFDYNFSMKFLRLRIRFLPHEARVFYRFIVSIKIIIMIELEVLGFLYIH